MRLSIPFDMSALSFDIPDKRIRGVVAPSSPPVKFPEDEEEIVKAALADPIASPRLAELARNKNRITVITSDHTRPLPSRITLPHILDEIRQSAPAAKITVIIATGCHREMTEKEMRQRFGDAVFEGETFFIHDCLDDGAFVDIGVLPSGGRCILNKAVLETDLLVAEGFIEPHFFAGFSGGRKAVLPGCASRTTVLANHCSEFIAHDKSRTGILDGNPIHADMVFAARKANLAFILNVVLDKEKRIVAAFAGDMEKAHAAGCEFYSENGRVRADKASIVITSNGGYPLDQNVYQSVKCMTAAEACCRSGGVIIVAAGCRDGHGGEEFSRAFEKLHTPENVMRAILARERNATEPDQWQIQILCRILMKHRVIMVTGPGAPAEMIEKLRMNHAASIEEAIAMAGSFLGDPEADILVIPDGVGVIAES